MQSSARKVHDYFNQTNLVFNHFIIRYSTLFLRHHHDHDHDHDHDHGQIKLFLSLGLKYILGYKMFTL